MEKLGINLGFLLFQIFNFIIVVVLLYAWAYKPLLNMMDARKKKIAQGLEDAHVAAEARANAEKDAAKIISDAQAKSAQVVREASERAETAGREIRAQVDAEIAKERADALVEVERERERNLSELRGQVAALAISVAQKLIGNALDDQRQHALIDEFFSGVRSGKVTVLDNVSLSGAAAEVTSALPLSAEEKEVVKRDILSKIGDQATITFRVDPTILGGLVVKVGDKLLDASVAGQLGNLRQSMV
jgi:F-type H+-transporting ATPase subunit b